MKFLNFPYEYWQLKNHIVCTLKFEIYNKINTYIFECVYNDVLSGLDVFWHYIKKICENKR